MDKPQFVYVTYISASPEKIFKALIEPETTTKYWQNANFADWKPGARWEHRTMDGTAEVLMVGKVIEFSPPRRLVLTWGRPADEAREEKHSRVTLELEPMGDVVRLTVTHDRLDGDAEMLEGISDGWPKVLSSLKSLMEVGKALPRLW